MIKGITVTLYERTQSGVDALNKAIYTESPIKVQNVIVSPATAEEVTDSVSLYGRKAVYTLCIPKGDTHDWTGCKVTIKGTDYRVIGAAEEWIDDMLPLAWNKKIKVERYE